MKPASEVLREAKAVLFERGWHKGSFENSDGSVCAWGAINIASAGVAHGAVFHPAFDALSRVVARPGNAEPSIPTWNDAPETTFDDVCDAFDLAEKQALIKEEGAFVL